MSDRPLRRLLRRARQELSCFVQKAFCTLEPGTAYQHNWHVDHCAKLSRRPGRRRLILNVPPRSMKSITASVAFPAWVLGMIPRGGSSACPMPRTSPASSRSTPARSSTPLVSGAFPRLQLASKRPRNTDLITTAQGYRFAAGVGGSVLGRGADLIIVDDPIKATDALSAAQRRRVAEFYDNTLYTRLNDKRTGAIVLIMQRLHQDDLVGHVLERDDWEVVAIPAIATEDRSYQLSDDPGHVYLRRAGEVLQDSREPRAVLEQIRRSQGSLTFSAQYQQAPVPAEGNIVKREWLRFYDDPPSAFDFTVASWDTASTLAESADYSVGTVWGAKGSTSICSIACAGASRCRSCDARWCGCPGTGGSIRR